MRRLFTIIILLCIAYFLGGWIAVHFGVVSRDDYFAYAGIVGGLASAAGLFALTRPALTQSDVQAIEIDTLKSMTETAEQLKILQTARSKTAEELDGLELKKKEMELLVKKASLALFLKEQYSHYERQVLDEISKNNDLQESLDKASEMSTKLAALNEEIDTHPNVRQLREIIVSASRRQPTLDEAISDLPPLTRSIFIFARSLSRALTDVIAIK